MKTWTQPADPRFWEALADGGFALPQCGRCGARQGPDASACERCEWPLLAWGPAEGTGSVFCAMSPWGREGELAAPIVVVDLDEGPRLMGALAGTLPGADVTGLRVAVSAGGPPRPDRLPEFVVRPPAP